MPDINHFFIREHAPSIIFMDEIDSIGSSRIESGSGGDSEVQRTMLELLNQLDGFEATKNIKVCHGSEMGPPSTTENVRILNSVQNNKQILSVLQEKFFTLVFYYFTLILPVWYKHVTCEFALCDTHVNDTKLAVIKH